MNKITTDKLQKVCNTFDLGVLFKFESISEGVLNVNYKVYTDKGEFFIKSVRNKIVRYLGTINFIESYMKENGIPAIVMLKTKSGDLMLEIDGEIFTAYPFIESDRAHQYSNSDYFKMGQVLAEIHKVTKDHIPDSCEFKDIKVDDTDGVVEALSSYKDRIIKKENEIDETDTLFLEYINRKLDFLSIIENSNEIFNHQPHILHGDYHSGNLLFDNTSREIIGVCDWEKTVKGNRAYEIARSSLYLFENFEEDLDKFNNYIKGYQSIYPISTQELYEGFVFMLKKIAKSKWIEEFYYDNNNDRSNRFIKNDIIRLSYFKPLLTDGGEEFFRGLFK